MAERLVFRRNEAREIRFTREDLDVLYQRLRRGNGPGLSSEIPASLRDFATAELRAEVRKMRRACPGISYFEAVKAVMEDSPSLLFFDRCDIRRDDSSRDVQLAEEGT